MTQNQALETQIGVMVRLFRTKDGRNLVLTSDDPMGSALIPVQALSRLRDEVERVTNEIRRERESK